MKQLLIFTAGVVVGSAAMYFAVRNHFNELAEERINAEVSSVKEVYMKRAAAKDLADKNEEEKRKLAESQQASTPDIPDEELSPDPSDPEEQKTIQAIQRIRRGYDRNVFDDPPADKDYIPPKDEEDEEDDGFAVETYPTEGAKEYPYPITAEQWNQECRYFDKITIWLFRDNYAIDEQEREVDDLEQLIGEDNLEHLADLADEEGVVLIRNEMRSSDYEVILMRTEYIPDNGIPVRDE